MYSCVQIVVSAGGELAINAFQNLAGSEDSDRELTINAQSI
jgi:hypothetical protein